MRTGFNSYTKWIILRRMCWRIASAPCQRTWNYCLIPSWNNRKMAHNKKKKRWIRHSNDSFLYKRNDFLTRDGKLDLNNHFNDDDNILSIFFWIIERCMKKFFETQQQLGWFRINFFWTSINLTDFRNSTSVWRLIFYTLTKLL